ncbi:MFS transporter [Paraburkholderia sp. J12]|uniref:MFS transporter n=1 Tax=Paraburkholderia sp. J12 TaxID=2805432 RepID=UPI002ABE023D|nr:MFS transporter [Paraburkholderia sp. J12]
MQSQQAEQALPFDLSGYIEERKVGLFHFRLVVMSFVIALADGFDLALVGLIAPSLIKDFGVAPASLGILFSAGLAGMVLGALLFAFIGDRFGRKAGVIGGCFIFGFFTLLSTWSNSLETLIILRFLTGLGLAGIVPNLVSLNAEYLPRNVRSLFIGIVLVGIPVGGAVAAWSSAILLPQYGWRSLFLAGGAAAVIVALSLVLLMPESVKFLGLRAKHHDRLRALVKKIYGLEHLATESMEQAKPAAPKVGLSPRALLAPGYANVTLLLWLLCFLNYGVVYFLFSWVPTVFRAQGFTVQQTGALLSIMPIGGIIGSLAVSALMERWGMLLVGALMLLAIPVSWVFGSPHISFASAVVFGILGGICIIGCQTGLIVASGLVYPTSIRAKGAGWAAGIGRVGSVLGPLFGSLLLKFYPLPHLLIAPVVPMSICLVATLLLTALLFRRFGNFRVGEVEPSIT